ncbi:transposase, partial [Shigella boydii]
STLKSPSYTKSVSWQHYHARFIKNPHALMQQRFNPGMKMAV